MSQKRLSTMERAAVGVLAVVVLASGLYFARKSGTNPEVYRNDFNVYYHAAREVMGGGDPYQHSLGDWTPYIYPPLLAELILPLALLPLPVASFLWFLINAASILAAAWMSARLADRNKEPGSPTTAWRAALAGCAVVLVLRFVLDSLNLGQVNGVVAALAVAHVYLYARDRKALSAIALVVAVSIKLTPALLLLYHIAKLRLKFSVACVALLVAVTALSFLPFGSRGTDAFQTFWNRTVKNEQGYDFAYSGNQSLRGAIARLAGQSNESTPSHEGESRRSGDAATLLISIVLLGFAVFAAVRSRSELAAAAPVFCCLVLLSPLSWKAHYVILILPAAHLLFRAKTSGKARNLIAVTLGLAFLLFNLTSPHVIGLAAAEWADAHSLVLAGALLIFIACAASTQLADRS
jgi:alpha-1,2-mannosyltransferase